jgi:DNA mismatch endonuclease, patch repair protein
MPPQPEKKSTTRTFDGPEAARAGRRGTNGSVALGADRLVDQPGSARHNAGVKTPAALNERVRRQMRTTRTQDTGPELRLRAELHRRGLRYRVHAGVVGLPRSRVDVLFRPTKVAVFVDGCFWHGCKTHKSVPQSNSAWWAAKLTETTMRDRRIDDCLRTLGYVVLRFWEHDDPSESAKQVMQIIESRRH